MNLKSLKTDLLKEVGHLVGEAGFKRPGGRGQTFYKKTDTGRWAFHLTLIEHDADFDVTADVAVRFDALEDLVNADSKLLSRSEKNSTFTLGAELGSIRDGRPCRWTVSSQPDVPVVAREIHRMFEDVGLTYLSEYGTLEKALTALQGDDRSAWVHSPLHVKRAKSAVGIAFLLGDYSQVLALEKSKKDFLREKRDPQLASFVAFCERLATATKHPG